jgi:hypothetical protein
VLKLIATAAYSLDFEHFSVVKPAVTYLVVYLKLNLSSIVALVEFVVAV